jgi:hypothetical protein
VHTQKFFLSKLKLLNGLKDGSFLQSFIKQPSLTIISFK